MPWQPGQSGNPKGRAPRATERAYLATVQRLCDPKTWGRIVERAIVDALDGDRHAREWLGNYLLGRPTPLVENETPEAAPTTADLAAALSDDEVRELLLRLEGVTND